MKPLATTHFNLQEDKMIHNFETGFRDGMKTFYYDYEPYQLTIRTTNYLIKAIFKTPFTREWLSKLIDVDLSRITEREFTLYVSNLLHHVSKGSRCIVVRTYDNKIIE